MGENIVSTIDCQARNADGKARIRVAAYARVSTAHASQTTSYDNQVEIYTKRIVENPDWDFAGVYADPEVSGTTDDRPEFQRLIRDAEKHKFDMVLVKSISRFARNTLVSIQTIRRMQANGVRLIFEKENLDTSDPASEMMLTIMSAFAQEESRNISERVKKGLRMRALNGEVNWTPLYGYRKVGDKPYVIEESEARIVRRIFDESEKGRSLREIAEGLNADEILSPNNKEWDAMKVHRVISNERYAGEVLTNKKYTASHIDHKLKKNNGEIDQVHLTNHHDAIIEKEQFERVQLISKMKSEGTYPFGGLLRCPHCRGLLQYEPNALPNRKSAWKCDEDLFYLPADKMDELVLTAYARLDASDAEDKTTKQIKAEHPTFERADYWWTDALIDYISFGEHEGKDDHTMTVHWHCGMQTTVHTDFPDMKKVRYKKQLRDRKQQTKTGRKKVSRIPGKQTAADPADEAGLEATVTIRTDEAV